MEDGDASNLLKSKKMDIQNTANSIFDIYNQLLIK
jgi:hypothetical protein